MYDRTWILLYKVNLDLGGPVNWLMIKYTWYHYGFAELCCKIERLIKCTNNVIYYTIPSNSSNNLKKTRLPRAVPERNCFKPKKTQTQKHKQTLRLYIAGLGIVDALPPTKIRYDSGTISQNGPKWETLNFEELSAKLI